MYAPDGDLVKDSLRQGDILAGILVMGAINIQGVNTTSDVAGNKVSWTVPQKPEQADVAVLSHSCEVDRANNVKVTSVIVAPVRDINTATQPSKIEEVRKSNLIGAGTENSYLKYFYLEPNEKLQYRNGAVVDFSKCFSIRKNAYDFLVKQKIVQLTEEMRAKFGLKLALYFHRSEKPSEMEREMESLRRSLARS